uniref:Uncharacterized protein n=1 Tax=Onchocerca volvulus TaxID=6282 RepID=A0A8R1XZH2_ONCVO
MPYLHVKHKFTKYFHRKKVKKGKERIPFLFKERAETIFLFKKTDIKYGKMLGKLYDAFVHVYSHENNGKSTPFLRCSPVNTSTKCTITSSYLFKNLQKKKKKKEIKRLFFSFFFSIT